MIRMRSWRNTITLFITIAMLGLTAPNTYAAVKAGATCTKKSAIQVVGNKKYTCVLKGKKLVWDSGTLIKVSKPAVSPSPTPTSTSTPTPTIAKSFVASAKAELNQSCNENNVLAFTTSGPVVCKGEIWTLVNRDSSISAAAYWSVLDRWNKQPAVTANLDIHKDLRAGDWVNSIEAGIQAGARFWGTSSSSSPVLPVFISNSHLYIQDEIQAAGLNQSVDSKLRNAQAVGGQAGFNNDAGNSTPYLDFVFKRDVDRNSVGFYQVGPHEYTHYAQFKIGGTNWQTSGPWLIEGVAAYIGSALGPMSGMPHNQLIEWTDQLNRTNQNLIFFGQYGPSVTSSSDWTDVYPLGVAASEALIALVGMDSLYNFFADLGKGTSYQDSSKRNLGVGSEALISMLSDYVKSVKSKNAWSLSELRSKYQTLKS